MTAAPSPSPPPPPPPPPPVFSLRSMRLWITVLLMFGLCCSNGMKLNLSMAITCMVEDTGRTGGMEEESSQCFYSNRSIGEATASEGDLSWSPAQQSTLFSATFYGTLLTLGFSGLLADRFGAKHMFIACILLESLLTLLTPLIARWSYVAFFASRFVFGMLDGFMYPCANSLGARWIPVTERATLAALYTSGQQVGGGLSSLISALLCASPLGWPSIFIVCGLFGVCWCFAWCVFTTNHPADNRWIGEEEREYLDRVTLKKIERKSTPPVPWRRMFTSPAFICIVIIQTSYYFINTIVQAFLPTYFKEVLHLPISMNGNYMLFLYATQIVAKNLVGNFSDYMRRTGRWKATQAAKIIQTSSGICISIGLGCLAFASSCELPHLTLLYLFLYGFGFSSQISGFFTSMLNLAPQFSGTITSITMLIGNFAGLVGPNAMAYITTTGTIYKWPIVFGACAASNVIACVVFYFCGSAEVQEWAKPSQEKEKKNSV